MGVEVRGFKELGDKLNSYPQTVKTEVGYEIEASAQTIVRNAQVNSPIDKGRLRSLISYFKTGDLQYTVVAAANYSAYQEFGTGDLVSIPTGYELLASQFKGKGQRKANINPHPFLIPAFEAEQPLLLERINTILKTSL